MTNDRSQYGGFWIRFSAVAADTVILLLPQLAISFLSKNLMSPVGSVENTVFQAYDTILSIVIWWIYAAGFHSSSWQATPGKRICGLKVVDYDGERISFPRATGRYFAQMFFCLVTLGIGWIMVTWTARRQCIHDIIAGTLVVKSEVTLPKQKTATKTKKETTPEKKKTQKSDARRRRKLVAKVFEKLAMLFLFLTVVLLLRQFLGWYPLDDLLEPLVSKLQLPSYSGWITLVIAFILAIASGIIDPKGFPDEGN